MACSATKPISPEFEQELAGIYTCARYYHLVGDPDTGDLAVKEASTRGKSESADPLDMIVVYLRAKEQQDVDIREHVEANPDAIGTKSSLSDLLDPDDEPEINQMDQINSAHSLYSDFCSEYS